MHAEDLVLQARDKVQRVPIPLLMHHCALTGRAVRASGGSRAWL